MAAAACLNIIFNMQWTGITIITDKKSMAEKHPLLDNIIQQNAIVIKIVKNTSTQKRRFIDGNEKKLLSWHNFNRCDAYELTNYTETIVLDVDYIIQENNLLFCWNSYEDFLINKEVKLISGLELTEPDKRLSKTGIPMYWATVFYFRKTERTKCFFKLLQYVRENYHYYSELYGFDDILFRNDYVFSIAIHIMSNFKDSSEFKSLPVPYLLTAFQEDIPLAFSVNSVIINVKDKLIKIDKMNVHLMNKFRIHSLVDFWINYNEI